ncbi:MAG: cytochrome c-type biogenesis CcmF C-terminal domain-containing protein, partial [Acidimicrobiales bacterium]
DRLGAGALAVCGAVAVFFFGLLAFPASPFRTLAAELVPLDGPGPNPLLQDHPFMAIHPPLLYAGYVGFTAPFAFAVSALALGVRGPGWVRRTQRWTLGAWALLSAGIVLGAWWSYEVLGWGGYWAWDPVENASLLPWLAATAYLHSATIQARRGLLQAWSIALVLATYALTILGTFLTRSGVVASVHAFSQSAVGPLLLGFLAVVVIGAFGLFAARADVVAAPNRLESLASREGAFLVNNLLLSLFAVTVLVGTTYPLVVEAVGGGQLSVGRPFFDRFAIPISLVLLLAVGLGPLLPYRAARRGLLWSRARVPVVLALAVGAVAVAVPALRAAPYVVLVLGLATLVIAAMVSQLAAAVRRRRRGAPGEAVPLAAGRVLLGEPGYWAGQMAHAGLVVLAVGIAVSGNLADRAAVSIEPGETVTFGGYDVTFAAPFEGEEPNRRVRGAELVLSRDGGDLATLRPRLAEFENRVQPVGTPAVWTGPTGDEVYIAITSLGGSDTGAVGLDLHRFPMIALIWFGGVVLAGSGGLGLALRWAAARRPVPAAATEPAGDSAPTARPRWVVRALVPVAAALGAAVLVAVVTASPASPDRAEALADRLRCPVCQGESVADSPSSTAAEMRGLIGDQVAAGRTDADILAFFETRYGAWIRLDAPFSGRTVALWLAPAAAFALGVAAVASRRGHGDTRSLTDVERAAVARARLETVR